MLQLTVCIYRNKIFKKLLLSTVGRPVPFVFKLHLEVLLNPISNGECFVRECKQSIKIPGACRKN